MSKRLGLFWFRHSDLRLHDNNALNSAIDLVRQKKLDYIVPFYCFDRETFEGKSRQAQLPRAGPHRKNFLLDCVSDLRENLLKDLNSQLFIGYGRTEEEIMKFVDEVSKTNIQVDLVIASKEICTEEVALEKRVSKLLSQKNVTLKLVWDSTMIHLDDLPTKVYTLSKGFAEFPDVFTQFRKSSELGGKESTYQVRTPRLIGGFKLPALETKLNWNEPVLPNKVQIEESTRSSVFNLKGGESNALKRVEHYFFNTDGLENYKSTRNGLIGTEYSSKFSIWLSHGCLSPRYLYHKVKSYEEKHGPSEGTKCMVFELLWRDFFKYIALKYGSKLFHVNGCVPQGALKYQWKIDPNLFDSWCKGETGYPFVDANMKELNETGFMSNRGRQNVASFLTKDLEIDWRYGAEYFETMLIDHDPCSNWGNWQYAAGVGTDPRQDRYFNTIKQAYDYDPKGDYARLWLPALQKVSDDLIYCPFRMSLSDQKRFGCFLGKDYPQTIVKTKFEWKPNSRNKVNKFAANQANSRRNKF